MENNQPLVSVIMNCYNSDKYLKEAIDSVIAQTYQNWEIIFWDNQSTDKSAEIVKSYNDERIKYFYAVQHTLLGQARNLAVEKAKGEWINFLDCDDMWNFNKLENQLFYATEKAGILYSRMQFVIESDGVNTNMAKSIKINIFPKLKILPSGNIMNDLLYDCFIPLPSALIRKDLFLKVGGIDSNMKVAEDYDIFLKIAFTSEVIAIDKVLCKYRVHSNNMSHTNIQNILEESIFLVKRYLPNKFAKKALIKWELQYLKQLLKYKYYRKFFLKLFKFNFLKIPNFFIK